MPADWDVRLEAGVKGPAGAVGHGIVMSAPGGRSCTLWLELHWGPLSPRTATALASQLGSGGPAALVCASWISPRAQELLSEHRINYVDPTGNVWVRADEPALFISSVGATRDPEPPPRGLARVRGAKAGRLIRTLVDTRPPYGVRDLARAIGLAPGYVSRMLDTLHREGMVERDPRGGVLFVHVAPLLDRWAEHYDVLRANDAKGFVSRAGTAAVMADLASVPGLPRVAVSGSFAAYRIAPVAAPARLLLYCEDRGSAVERLGLLPADAGADVLLLRPFDEVVWDGVHEVDGIEMVAPSQVAIDCLTGTGRMPAEGAAVVEWMEREERAWRRDALRAVGD